MAKKPNRVGGVAVDQLKSIIGRVEKLEEEKSGISADIRDVFAEAKGSGFDVKAIRSIIKLRKMDAAEVEEQETIFDTYRRALGMLPELDEEDEPVVPFESTRSGVIPIAPQQWRGRSGARHQHPAQRRVLRSTQPLCQIARLGKGPPRSRRFLRFEQALAREDQTR